MKRVTMMAAALTIAVSVAACGGNTAPDGTGPRVIASTSIIGDVADNVAGDAASVEVLIPPGADPHSFQASARQAAALTAADLVIVNGLGLEESLQPVLDAAIADGANVLELGSLLDPIPFAGGDHLDPHVWLDPNRMADAAAHIASALAEVQDGTWEERATSYREDVLAGAAAIESMLSTLPADRRILVTNHDSLGYFADRFGFEIVGVVIPGGSSVATPSAADLVSLAEVIRSRGVPAVFTDAELPDDVAAAIAREVGEGLQLVPLYTGSLGPAGSGAETYLDMLTLNARRIAAALGE